MASGGDQLALFNQYDDEYSSKITAVATSIQKISALSGDQRRAKVKDADADLKEADRIMRRMEMEARSFSQPLSSQMLTKVREYKAECGKLQQEVRAASSAASGGQAARQELGLGDDFYATSSGQRERMLQSTEKLNKTGDRIRQGRQQLLETEELGVSILQDLHRQRETIVHSRDTLHGADDNIAKARRTLASMSRRVMTNKIIMAGIALLLIAAIALVVYYKYIKK